MDKHKIHFLSPEDTEEIRKLEQQELAFWRGSVSKRLAGWTRDGSAEEIARDSTKMLKQKGENCKRRSRGNQGKMPEWTTPWMVWMVLCRHEGANTDIASNKRV